MFISINAHKLARLVEARDKRLKRLPKKGETGHIPKTSFDNHRICQRPNLEHACTYERVLGLRPRDWLVPHEATVPPTKIVFLADKEAP